MTELLWVGFVTGSDPEHDVGGVEAPSTSPDFWRAPHSDPDSRTILLHHGDGSRPGTGRDGIQSADHQPARLEIGLRPSTELLPNNYFHVVFTLPHELGPLARRNRKAIFDLIFSAAARTLLDLAKDEYPDLSVVLAKTR